MRTVALDDAPGDAAGAPPPATTPRWRRQLGPVVAAAAPWAWFAVRDLHPMLDLVAIGLPLAVVAVAVWPTVRFVRRPSLPRAAVVASIVTFGLVAVLAPMRTRAGVDPAVPIRVVASNVTREEDAASEVRDRLLATDPDLLVVAELGPGLHEVLEPEFSSRAVTPIVFKRRYLSGARVGVYSDWDLRTLHAPRGFPGLRLAVDHPDEPFIVYALHIPKPSLDPDGYSVTFAEHRRLVDLVAESAANEQWPVVVAGDLNSSDRGGDYRRLVRHLDDAVATGDPGPTSFRPIPGWSLLFLRIDHILISSGWCANDGGRLSVPHTDHRAVTAVVGPCGPVRADAGRNGEAGRRRRVSR